MTILSQEDTSTPEDTEFKKQANRDIRTQA